MSSNSGPTNGKAFIRDASDVTLQRKRQMTYLNFTQDSGAPKYTTDNGNESYLAFLFGKKECDAGCTGLPFQKQTVRLYR